MSGLGVWVRAARPRTLAASAAPVFTGSGLAASRGEFDFLPAAACLIAASLIQVGTNFYNDYSDWARGVDTPDRSGETRVTQAGLLTPDQVRGGAWVALGAAVAVGFYLAAVGGWPIVAIGVASVICAVTYTGGPWPFGYHGLGDLFVFVFFGLVAVAGTHYVQADRWTAGSLWAGAGLGAVSTAVLVANNLRDIPTDREAGKRTLAVIIGPDASRVEYGALLLLAAAVPPVGVLVFGWPPPSLAALAGFVLVPGPARRVLGTDPRRDASSLDPAVGGTARVLGAYGILLAVGLAL